MLIYLQGIYQTLAVAYSESIQAQESINIVLDPNELFNWENALKLSSGSPVSLKRGVWPYEQQLKNLQLMIYGWVRIPPTNTGAQVFGLILLTVWFGLCSLLGNA